MTHPSIRAELRLVIECCRWPDSTDRRTRVAAAVANVVDWDLFTNLTTAHRVEGLVADALTAASGVPDPVRRWCSDAAAEVRAHSLVQLTEAVRLGRALTGAGIAFTFLKGSALGVALYGSPTIKHSWDIDILVSPADAVAAAAALRSLGYSSVKPARDLTAAEFARWSAVAKDAELRSPRGIPVELHWRLSDLPYVLTDLDVHTPRRMVSLLGEERCPIFADAQNLAYLAVHGAAAGWSRLKWAADFGALLASHQGSEQEAMIASARKVQTGPALDQALLIQQTLFGAVLSNDFRPCPDAVELAGLAMTVITRRRPGVPIEQDRVALKAIRKCRRMLLPQARYRAALAIRRLRGLEDRLKYPLPTGLHWLYWGIRPFTFLRRAVRTKAR